MVPKSYAVPAAIAERLKLTAYRRKDGNGFYLLSRFDLQGYGISNALADGAEELTTEEARVRFANN